MKNQFPLPERGIRLAVAAVFLFVSTTVLAQNTFPATGKVGVGTQTPAKDLEVVGETRLEGDVETDGKVRIGDAAVPDNVSHVRKSNT